MKRWIKLGVAAVISGMVLPALPGSPTPLVSAAASDLFISEYVEGSSLNKAIEIYNGTGAAVDVIGQVGTTRVRSGASET